MDGVAADPCDENTVITEILSAEPEHNITVVTGQEVTAAFIVSRLVYLDAENVPVVKHHQSPAIRSVERACAVHPGDAGHTRKEIVFRHSEAPDILLRCTGGRRCGLAD